VYGGGGMAGRGAGGGSGRWNGVHSRPSKYLIPGAPLGLGYQPGVGPPW